MIQNATLRVESGLYQKKNSVQPHSACSKAFMLVGARQGRDSQ